MSQQRIIMNLANKIVAFTLRQAIGEVGDKVFALIERYYTDPTKALPKAIDKANTQTWHVIELALAGDSMMGWLKGKMVSGVERGILGPLKEWVQSQGEDFRRNCLLELRAARQAGLLTGAATGQELVAAGDFTGVADPDAVLDGAQALMVEVGTTLRIAYPNLARFLVDSDGRTGALLVSAFGYFLRQAVASQPGLCDELQFNRLSQIWHAQAQGWEALGRLLTEQGEALAAELERFGAGQAEIKDMLREVLERLPESARRGSVSPRLSASLRSVADVRLFEELERRLNALPAEQHTPEILDVVGRLAMAVGVFSQAEAHFAQAAAKPGPESARAEAYYNTYRALLEQKRWDDALVALLAAARLDPDRFALFPLTKYTPKRILGAGGFGVAFLCEHTYLRRQLVIKTFHTEALERDFDEVFREGELLSNLRHPAIIHVIDGGYTNESHRQRPYLALEYFEAPTLDGYLARYGCLTLEDAVPLARAIAEAMQAAHDQNILHRDLKPDNLLVRRDANGAWEIKLIDFGLAMTRKVVAETAAAGNLDKSLAGESLGGTVLYSAPEQLGLVTGKIGPWSDVYAFGKTLSQAIFSTTQPSRKNYRALDDHPFADLLSDCLEQKTDERPQNFVEVMKALKEMKSTKDAEREEHIHQESILCMEAEEAARKKKIVEEMERQRQEQEENRRLEELRKDAEAKKLAEEEAARKKKATEEIVTLGIRRMEAEEAARNKKAAEEIERQPKPGEEREFAGIPFVWIPAGCFKMGSPSSEKDRRDNEGPVHKVCLDGFWMGKYEVTQGEWKKIMGNNPSKFQKGDDYPVELVSWNDTQEFIKKINNRGADHFRLPTEAEWEYACRAETTTPFHFGNTISADTEANYDGNYPYGNGPKGKSRASTTPVGSFPANAFGLYDMHGNVMEWVEDWYDEKFYASSDASKKNPLCKNHASGVRVLRGGSWYGGA